MPLLVDPLLSVVSFYYAHVMHIQYGCTFVKLIMHSAGLNYVRMLDNNRDIVIPRYIVI